MMTKKEIRSITLDPHLETADTDLENNSYPRRPVKSRFQLFKEGRSRTRCSSSSESRRPRSRISHVTT